MKKNTSLAAALLAAVLLISAGFALEPAQAQQRSGGGVRLAVIDVASVLKGSTTFKDLEGQLKADLQAKDSELRGIRDMAEAKRQSLADLNDKNDRMTVEKEIHELQFEFQQRQKQFQQEFLEKEADAIMSVYSEMSDLLGKYCERHGIHLVLRKDEFQSEVTDPRLVKPQIASRQVIYSHANLDLTKVILDGLNR